ncbi:37S ribosomal protein S9, mitochondrial [Erysiphe neolycopersici]|uniref:Small ribosomal subunit protein uS9m n=1 Tax=Erysiphe neolycopersici TaxID=212602 RepID=A0A420HXQ8_9PEZI|nr:37S ribosomal protein S9, mitochondrial [Erysiphe neolycopersici]
MGLPCLSSSTKGWCYMIRPAQFYVGQKRISRLKVGFSSTQPFSISSCLREIFMSPEIESKSSININEYKSPIEGIISNNNRGSSERQIYGDKEQDATCYARLVPESPSYFSVQPRFMDSLVSLDELLEKYKSLPVSAPGDTPKTVWLSVQNYRDMVGEKVKNTRYQQVLRILKRLNQIHPLYMPEEVKNAIQIFKRNIVKETASIVKSPIDRLGRSLGVGRRKTATGRAWLVEGTGEVLVNGKTLAEAFGRVHDRETVIWPLKSTGRIDKYNLWCRVEGGGTTGQAEALTLAVAKALLGHEPALKPALRRAGCVTRDPRKVERKKPGRLKARKKPAWVKR